MRAHARARPAPFDLLLFAGLAFCVPSPASASAGVVVALRAGSAAAPLRAAIPVFAPPAPGLTAVAAAPADHDASSDLQALIADVGARRAGPLPQSARKVRYLLVRGMLGNRIANYFDGNTLRLKSLGLDVQEIAIDTEGHRHADLRAIENAVRASPSPVVLLGHSRGGVLSHDWYRRASPELKAKIARLVVLQAPLKGSPLADENVATRLKRLKLDWAGKLLFGEGLLRVIVGLTTRVRARVLAGLPAWAPGDLEKTYALRGLIVSPARHPYYFFLHRALVRLGSPRNDGRVPDDSARIPGAHEALLLDVDHDNAILRDPGWFKRLRGARRNPRFDPGDFTEALVRLMFR